MEPAPLDWSQAYAKDETPWDLRAPSPPLLALLERGLCQELQLGAGARVAVPGCGRGHDLRVFSKHGADVTGFDIVPAACEEARALLRLNQSPGRVECRDVFGLSPEYDGHFDLVYDYTCFCALQPHLRPAYVKVMRAILRPGGYFLHLSYPMRAELAGPPGKPPFLIEDAALQRCFGPHFELASTRAAERSVPRRAGAELWYLWRTKGA